MTDIIKKHPSIILSQDINEICRPLQKLNITYFGHAKIINGNKFTTLCNNPSFTEHYLSNKYYNPDLHMIGKIPSFKDYVVWDAIPHAGDSYRMDHESVKFGVKHTFTIIEINGNVGDYYHFATDITNDFINQIYLSNIDLLKNFIRYFNEKIAQSKALSKAYDIQFDIDNKNIGFDVNLNNSFISDDLKSRFLNEISHGRSYETSKLASLSVRQQQCLYYLAQGMTQKSIAAQLTLSPKTIEHYIVDIKNKLNCSTQSELIRTAWELHIWDMKI